MVTCGRRPGRCACGVHVVCGWCVSCMYRVCKVYTRMYARDMHVVCIWYERGMHVVVDVVHTRCARGMHAVCACYTRGIHVVSTWWACSMHVVRVWYVRGMHGVCTWYARGMHAVCTWSARGMPAVCMRCARTFNNSRRASAKVRCSIRARASVNLPFWCINPSKAPNAPIPQRMRQPDRNDRLGDVVPAYVQM